MQNEPKVQQKMRTMRERKSRNVREETKHAHTHVRHTTAHKQRIIYTICITHEEPINILNQHSFPRKYWTEMIANQLSQSVHTFQKIVAKYDGVCAHCSTYNISHGLLYSYYLSMSI